MTGIPVDRTISATPLLLIGLNVEEKNVRLALVADGLELREQDIAAEIEIERRNVPRPSERVSRRVRLFGR